MNIEPIERKDLLTMLVLQIDTTIQIALSNGWIKPEDSAFFLFDVMNNLIKRMIFTSHDMGATKENIGMYLEENFKIMANSAKKYISGLEEKETVIENPVLQ